MIDPITLLTAGPTVIRAIGRLFGGGSKAAEVANTVADVVDAVTGKPPAEQRRAVNDAIAQLTPEQRVEWQQLQVELAKVAAEREARQLEHQETLHESTQATFRATEQYGTDFAKNTRPLLARVSGIAGLAVGAVWTLLYVIGKTERAPDPTVIGMLMSMAFTYMGMRTVDAFSRKGKS